VGGLRAKHFTAQSVKIFTRAEHTDLVSIVNANVNAKTKEKSRVNRDAVTALAAVLAILLICFGVAAMRPSYPPVESHPFVASMAAGAARPAAGGGPVVMHVNGEPVTQKEFELYLTAAPEQMRSLASTPEGRRVLAEQLVTMKVLEQDGRKMNAEGDPDVALQMSLMRANAAAGYALQKLVGEPTDADLRIAYEKEKATTGERQVRHILIACGDGQIPSRTGRKVPCEAALQKARQLGASIHSRADFERAARAESDDTNSGAEGGLLGPLRQGSMPPDVEPVVFALKPDEVSRPLQTQFGWHLFTAGPPEPEPFARVRPLLVQKWKQARMQMVLASAKQSAKVDYDPKFFGPERQQVPPTGLKKAS
jgi:peptidyl-prolyl cis-trans isomerase C